MPLPEVDYQTCADNSRSDHKTHAPVDEGVPILILCPQDFAILSVQKENVVHCRLVMVTISDVSSLSPIFGLSDADVLYIEISFC